MLPFPEVLALVHDLCCDYNFAAAVAHINALFFFYPEASKMQIQVTWGTESRKSKALMKNVLAALH